MKRQLGSGLNRRGGAPTTQALSLVGFIAIVWSLMTIAQASEETGADSGAKSEELVAPLPSID